MSIGIALAAALVYGTGDFLGGLAARRAPLLSVLLLSQAVGLVGILAVAGLTGGTPRGLDLVAGAAGGIAGAAGLALLYGALASGQMSLVAPVTGVVAVAIPVAVGIAGGERPGAPQDAGIAVAVVAVALLGVSGSGVHLDGRRLLLAAGAGIAFGLFYVALSRASIHAGLWPVAAARGASVTVLGAISVATRRPPGFGRSRPAVVIAAGLFDVTANALYLLAVQRGSLSVVAVAVSLYPASTVVLSVLVLGERLRRAQLAGVVAALAAAALISAG